MQRRGTVIWLAVTSIVFGAMALVLSFPLILASAMMFDAPDSQTNPPTLLLFWSAISFPILCIFSIIASWVLYKFTRDVAARLVSLLPLVSVFLIFGGLSWSALSCAGQLNCQTSSTMQEQGNAIQVGQCASQLLDGGDGLKTTGCGVLAVDVSATGTIKSTSEAHNWQFSAQNSDAITITLEQPGNACSQIHVLDSNGRVIEDFKEENQSNTCSGGLSGSMTTTSYYHFKPPHKGVYILRITAPQAPGTYWLKIT